MTVVVAIEIEPTLIEEIWKGLLEDEKLKEIRQTRPMISLKIVKVQ
jgi:hypothetical protein